MKFFTIRLNMQCPHCGSSNMQKEFRYCPYCGKNLTSSSMAKKWFAWIAVIVAATAFAGGSWSVLTNQNIAEIPERQLDALRLNKITEAYYKYVSQEFQLDVPLAAFRELVKTYPILSNNQGALFHDLKLGNGEAIVKGALLVADNVSTPIEYELVKEDSNWKIRSILLAADEPKPAGTAETTTTSIAWLLPIDLQLRALRRNDIKAAYETSTSKDFRSATAYEDFKQFVEKYPILSSHTDITVKAQSVQEEQADITVILNPEKDAVPVRYLLKREDGGWKIWSMNITPEHSEAVTTLLKDLKSMRQPVEGQLEALRDQNSSKAYYDFTSKAFQEVTPIDVFRKFLQEYSVLTTYDAIEFKEPIVTKTTGILEVTLHNKYGATKLEYTLGIESNQWKIWGIQVLSAGPQAPGHGTPDEKPRAPTTSVSVPRSATGNGPLFEFSHAEVGTQIDVKGKILDPTTKLSSPSGDIYVNLFIHNGKAHSKIDVSLQYLDSNAVLPTLSTSLQQDGDTVLSFSFEAPEKGWPKGSYRINATSPEISRSFDFRIE